MRELPEPIRELIAQQVHALYEGRLESDVRPANETAHCQLGESRFIVDVAWDETSVRFTQQNEAGRPLDQQVRPLWYYGIESDAPGVAPTGGPA